MRRNLQSSSASRTPLRFGTSGWRGVLGSEVTWTRLRAVLVGVGRWILEQGAGEQPILIAYDRRFFGSAFAAEALSILCEMGLKPICVTQPIATPVLTRAMARERIAFGICFTASHNPAEYHGVKVFIDGGASAPSAETRKIENWANAALREAPGRAAAAGTRSSEAPPAAWRSDLTQRYIEDVLQFLDRRALARRRVRVVYDALHGAGAGVLDSVLTQSGVEVRGLHLACDPRFGGLAPEPSPGRLRGLAQEVRKQRGLVLGLASDGDADRYGALSSDGKFLLPTEALAVLLDHLVRTGRVATGISVSVALGSLVERVALGYGLPVLRRPIGFKYMAADFAAGRSDLAGEESGGFALAAFGRDKDGILAGALLAEVVAASGVCVRTRLRELEAKHGKRVCSRKSVSISEPIRERLAQLAQKPPDRFGGFRVRAIEQLDGIRFDLDDGFLMFRASGTEPLLRIYAEAPSQRALEQRFAAGARAIGIEALQAG